MASLDENNLLTLMGQEILPGKSAVVNFNIARLYTTSTVEVPIIVERAKKPGPVVLITSGIHGDEINGVEIVRQLIARKINKPAIGTVICIPILNIFGFLDMRRSFPDGRDLNRVFPGTPRGSLASRFAYQFVKEILPVADYCLDFHTGGASRFNASQIRIAKDQEVLMELALTFNAPFTVFSKNIPKSYRDTCAKMGKPILLFEGGKSKVNDPQIARHGVHGAIRVLNHLGMLKKGQTVPIKKEATILIEHSKWQRAKYSGLLHLQAHCGDRVQKGDPLALITDPYGKFSHQVRSNHEGYIINTNEAALVYQGDAIFHITTSANTHDQSGSEEEI
ncbi:succinylglutamate desuccinylase/aspartoacylase family protein [Croceiramulus getboli]|nr:succinylglutamate desuccinylase/aspartoacylase family protein [Flavobacteriaceae bacterium YJPT1-3]